MRYKCVSPCRLAYCVQSRIDEVDLKLAFRKLPEEELLRRIEGLPADLRRKALEIHRAVWIS
jgi:hypothetical protein